MRREGESRDVRLDRALAGLPRELPPESDLWPGIAAQLEPRRAPRRWLPLAAAAVLLVVSSSLITARVVRRSAAPAAPVATVAPPATPDAASGVRPASFGPGHALSTRNTSRRGSSSRPCSRQRMDRLPSSARQKVEDNLAQLHRATDEINAALALQPGDALLEELLLNTYQDELAVLASVNQLANLNGTVVPEDEGIKL